MEERERERERELLTGQFEAGHWSPLQRASERACKQAPLCCYRCLDELTAPRAIREYTVDGYMYYSLRESMIEWMGRWNRLLSNVRSDEATVRLFNASIHPSIRSSIHKSIHPSIHPIRSEHALMDVQME